MLSVKAAASLLAFSSIWVLMTQFTWSYQAIYTLFGAIGLFLTLLLALSFKHFPEKTEQTKKIIIRKQYWLFAAKIGKFIGKVGERAALRIEYIGLIIIFISYGLVENSSLAALLYIVDHLFFALAIAIKTYFQKIAQPEDIAASAGVSFSINHIAAVVIPALLGMLWIMEPSWVFYIGAGFALCSLALALLIPLKPAIGVELRFQEVIKSKI